MNTHSHALMGAFLFGRSVPRRAFAGLLGGLTPDVPMLVIVGTLMAAGVPAHTIFDEMYWQNWWQITNAVSHSFLLWSGLLALGLILRGKDQRWILLAIFAGSALLHSCIDFLVHREDAHMSFWPLSRYKFMSPVSYYEPEHFGRQFSMFDSALGLVMTFVLAARFKNWFVRGLLGLCLVAYIGLPLMFILSLI
jgi:hypothetical protein